MTSQHDLFPPGLFQYPTLAEHGHFAVKINPIIRIPVSTDPLCGPDGVRIIGFDCSLFSRATEQ